MGQKMDPNGLRLGIIKDWNSKWYADSKNFADYLVEDYKIRKYIEKKLHAAGISKVEIERTAKFVKINVYTAKPGLIIGKGGNLAEALKAELEKMINKQVNLNIVEVLYTVDIIKLDYEVIKKVDYNRSLRDENKIKLIIRTELETLEKNKEYTKNQGS